MELSVVYGATFRHKFHAQDAAGLKTACGKAWDALEIQLDGEGKSVEFPPLLMMRNTYTKFDERWVPAGYTYPPKPGQLINAPHPYREKDTDWTGLWARIRQANAELAGSSQWLDGLESGGGQG